MVLQRKELPEAGGALENATRLVDNVRVDSPENPSHGTDERPASQQRTNRATLDAMEIMCFESEEL
jgi:hypothetical protein